MIIAYRQMSNFAAISWREQVTFNEMMMMSGICFVLDQHAEVDFYSARSLKQQSAGRRQCRSTRSHYSDSEPTSLCSYSIMLSGEALNTNFKVFGLTRPGLESMIYHTRGEHVNHYTTDAVLRTISCIINRQWLYRPHRIFTLYEIQISVNR